MSAQEREPPGWPDWAAAVMRIMLRRMRRAMEGSSSLETGSAVVKTILPW